MVSYIHTTASAPKFLLKNAAHEFDGTLSAGSAGECQYIKAKIKAQREKLNTSSEIYFKNLANPLITPDFIRECEINYRKNEFILAELLRDLASCNKDNPPPPPLLMAKRVPKKVPIPNNNAKRVHEPETIMPVPKGIPALEPRPLMTLQTVGTRIVQQPIVSPWSPRNWNWGKIGAGALIGAGVIGVIACIATGQLELLPAAAVAF
jgi:hypothetical protein